MQSQQLQICAMTDMGLWNLCHFACIATFIGRSSTSTGLQRCLDRSRGAHLRWSTTCRLLVCLGLLQLYVRMVSVLALVADCNASHGHNW